MHQDTPLLLTALDIMAWLALGGSPICAASLAHRCGSALPAPVVRLMAVGVIALAMRALSCGVGPLARPATLEHFAGGGRLGDAMILLGLAGLLHLAWAAFGPGLSKAARRRNRRRFCVAMAPVCVGLPYAMMPPWAPDESIYHLSLQLHGLLAGHTWAPLGHGNGGFFSLGEHYGGAALWMGSVSAARGAQVWLLIFAADAVWALWPQLRFAQVLLAQGLFVLSPIVVWQLGCAYVDISQAAFAIGATALTAHMVRRRAPQTQAVAAAWLWGCAVACKYSALPYGVLFVLVLLVWRARRHGLSTLPFWALCGVAFLLPFFPDVVHNLMRYHTPLFPFGAPWWPGAEELGADQRAALSHFMGLHGPTWDGAPVRGVWRYLMLPYAVLFAADFASVRFDGVLGQVPILLALLFSLRGLILLMGAWPTAHPGRASSRAPGLSCALWLYACAGVGIWVCTSLQARFLIGPLWAMAWLVALHWPPVSEALSGWHRWLPIAACLVCCALVGTGLSSLMGHMPPWRLSVLGQDRAGRTAARLAAVPASALCDAVPVSAQSKTMLVWSQRLSLFCLGEQVSDSYDEAATLKRVLTVSGGDAQAAVKLLGEQGIGYVLVHEAATHDGLGPTLWPRYLALTQAFGPPQAEIWPYRLYRVPGVGP